jgi:hypothetical protein
MKHLSEIAQGILANAAYLLLGFGRIFLIWLVSLAVLWLWSALGLPS